MANKEHLQIVMLGQKAISQWTIDNPTKHLDLSGANLRRINLVQCDLNDANLEDANLEWADLRWSDLKRANLARANLTRADFHKTDLSCANLSEANLTMTNLEDANLSEAILDKSILSFTRLISTCLFNTKGLETIDHKTASIVDKETFAKSGTLPRIFTKHLTSTKNMEAIQGGYEFERIVESMYRQLGLKVERDLILGGSQIDLLLTEKSSDKNEIKTAVECKSHKKPVGKNLVNKYAADIIPLINTQEIHKAIIVSKSGFTRYARSAARLQQIDLIDFDDLKKMVKISVYHDIL